MLNRNVWKRTFHLDIFNDDDDLERVTGGIIWFKRGSMLDGEPPTKHAIRITDVIVARASALLTHISIMLAVSAVIFQAYYKHDDHLDYDKYAYFLIAEMLAYLGITLICLRTIYLSGPSRVHSNKFDIQAISSEFEIHASSKECEHAKALLKQLKEQAENPSSEKGARAADVIRYYAAWKSKKNVADLDAEFINYTLLVLRRHEHYMRALFWAYVVTILFAVTFVAKLLKLHHVF